MDHYYFVLILNIIENIYIFDTISIQITIVCNKGG